MKRPMELEAVRLAASLVPDVVLMDIRMPGLDGLAATAQIASDARLSGVRIVVSPRSIWTSCLRGAARRGERLPRQGHRARRPAARRARARGDALLSPGVTRRLIAEFAPGCGAPGSCRAWNR